MLNQMSAANIKTTIDKLVSFGTRQTLSSTTDPKRGIGAARDYIFHTLQGYAAASGGRMAVAEQPFIQPKSKDPNARNPRNTQITNIVATLKGTQPASANRVYVVSGHYDSRCTGPDRLQVRRPRRRRRRLRRGGDDGDGTRHVAAQLRRHHQVHHRGRGGGGPVRLCPLRQGGQAAAPGHRGHAQQRHHRLRHRAQRAEDAVHGAAVLRGNPHRPHQGQRRRSAERRRRERLGGARTGPLRRRRWLRTTPPT